MAHSYERYELHVRPYSSNVIYGVYTAVGPNGKAMEKREIVVAPLLMKSDGDKYAEFILKCLNDKMPFRQKENRCHCGNPIDETNPDCVELSLCAEHSTDA